MAKGSENTESKKFSEIFVLHPAFKGPNPLSYNIDNRLEEAQSLVRAISLKVVHAEAVIIKKIRPATLFGTGIVETYKSLIAQANVHLVFIDGPLSPIQQRNLEKAWNVKVLDRTGLILEIFGERARTSEGALQVELAALTYQKSRLVRTWTHLERQRGGLGFIGGPGEKQIEMDRRLIAERIAKLKLELEHVKRTRELHRQARRRVPYPIVSLVGYTNAGKSTLFNRITKADVFAEDLLFATLDPTMRRVTLPSGRDVILSDTVGFITDLPTPLIAAFRATLEEVLEANLLVHVRDISHPQTKQQQMDVEKVLRELGLQAVLDEGGMIEALNKADLLIDPEAIKPLLDDHHIALSALTGQGISQLLECIDERLGARDQEMTVMVPYAAGDRLAWLYKHGKLLEREDLPEAIRIKVRLSPQRARKVKTWQDEEF